jgi:hypothetical protein
MHFWLEPNNISQFGKNFKNNWNLIQIFHDHTFSSIPITSHRIFMFWSEMLWAISRNYTRYQKPQTTNPFPIPVYLAEYEWGETSIFDQQTAYKNVDDIKHDITFGFMKVSLDGLKNTSYMVRGGEGMGWGVLIGLWQWFPYKRHSVDKII